MMHIIAKMTGVPLQKMEQKETAKASRDGSGDETARHRPGRSGHGNQQSAATFPCGFERSATADRLICFLGPTGVGKTFLARTLAEFMFGDSDALIQIDMSDIWKSSRPRA